jgi:hypothetical protein
MDSSTVDSSWLDETPPLMESPFKDLIPEIVLYDPDMAPMIYLIRDRTNRLHLVYFLFSRLEEKQHTYVVVPIDFSTVDNICNNSIDLYTALNVDTLWIVDIDYHDQIQAIRPFRFEGIPSDFLPKPGVKLRDE